MEVKGRENSWREKQRLQGNGRLEAEGAPQRTWVTQNREERNRLRKGQGEGEQGTVWGPRTELFSLEMMAKSSGDTSCKGGKAGKDNKGALVQNQLMSESAAAE